MTRPSEKMINDAIVTLASFPSITNKRIREVFAECLPAGYALLLQDGAHRGHGLCWTIQGDLGSHFSRWEPAVKGQGEKIITALLNTAWEYAALSGHCGLTAGELAARVARPLPVCRECGRAVLPGEGEASSHPDHHRDCA